MGVSIAKWSMSQKRYCLIPVLMLAQLCVPAKQMAVVGKLQPAGQVQPTKSYEQFNQYQE